MVVAAILANTFENKVKKEKKHKRKSQNQESPNEDSLLDIASTATLLPTVDSHEAKKEKKKKRRSECPESPKVEISVVISNEPVASPNTESPEARKERKRKRKFEKLNLANCESPVVNGGTPSSEPSSPEAKKEKKKRKSTNAESVDGGAVVGTANGAEPPLTACNGTSTDESKKEKKKRKSTHVESLNGDAIVGTVKGAEPPPLIQYEPKKKRKSTNLESLNGEAAITGTVSGTGSPALVACNGVSMLEKKKHKSTTLDSLNGEAAVDSTRSLPVGESDWACTDEPKAKKPKLELATPKATPGPAAAVDVAGVERAAAAIEGALDKFPISEETVSQLRARGVHYLFPVQSRTFTEAFEGKDLIVRARTGTGKTLAFGIPIVEKLLAAPSDEAGRAPRVIVMAPTRELAIQVAGEFAGLSPRLTVACIYGGIGYTKQENALWAGCDVVVGTPGRVLDFVEKGALLLDHLKHVVLDEVDRMLDMGFQETVETILSSAYKSENKPQTLLWSATLPEWVHATARKFMSQDLKVIDLVGQDRVKTSTLVQHLAIKCGWQDRPPTIANVLKVYSGQHGRAMVFCETKKEADELAVSDHIKVETHVMHGDIPQDKREMVLKGFREGRYKVLITTDVAARGLDIPEVDLVVQCSPPKDVDSYIHRAGRTGRAGKQGTCVCFYKFNQAYGLEQVERYAGIEFKRVGGPSNDDIIAAAAQDAVKSLAGVAEASLSRFREAAAELIAARGATDALAAALAAISGSTAELTQRSLLGSQEGFTTYEFRTNMELHGKGYVWQALGRHLPQEVTEKVRGMTFTKDKTGAVFDLPADLDSVVADRWTNGKFDSLEVATQLPELETVEASRGGFTHSGSNNFSPGGRGRFNNFRGGRGRGFSRGRGGSWR